MSNSSKKISKVLKENARNKKIVFILFIFLLVMISFGMGFLFRSQVNLMAQLGIPIGEEAPINISAKSNSKGESTAKSLKNVYNSLSARINEVESILSEYSFDNIDIDKSTKSVISSILQSTGDEYAKYYDEESYKNLLNDSKNKNYAGIGILFSEREGKVYASDVFANSEAEVKGVQTGDYITSIDGNSTIVNTASEVMNFLKNQVGNDILISWARPKSSSSTDSSQTFTTSLKVEKMDIENVTTEMKDHSVGVIKISQFNADVATLLKQGVQKLQSEGAKSFVIDVRNNPGGYMTGAIECASLFVPSGTIVNVETPLGNSARTTQGETITDAKIAILINENTVGSAEVFASALQENQRAICVGKKSAGKGTTAATRELSFGGAIRYTAAIFTTPSNNPIDKTGIKPNIDISNTSDDTDSQLAIALDNARM